MRKRATAEDVAKAAGVSKWTVIRAFKPGASITEDSRRRVMEAAEAMRYRPNLLARSLATNSTHQVAVFVDDFANPYKLDFLEALTGALQAHGLVAMLININERFDHVHALLNADQRQVDAIVLLGTSFRDETLNDSRLHEGGPPLYVLARDSQIDAVTSVSCETASAMRAICDHLVERGYRRPGFMTGPRTLSTALGRKTGFEEVWRERCGGGVVELAAGTYSHAAGAGAARGYLAAAPRDGLIDVLVCENDILAYGAMDVLRYEAKLKVPGDVAVVGFDDAGWSSTRPYDLTTFRQPVDEMVATLVAMLSGERDRESAQLPGRLMIRGST